MGGSAFLIPAAVVAASAGLGFVVASHAAPAWLLNLGKELARRGAGMARKRVEVAGHDLCYFERGQRGRGDTVLLLHGFGANKDGWLTYARGLRDYHVVILDLPGFGDSEWKLAERYGYREQVPRVKAFVDALGLAPLHIAGNSMGGGIAGIYAASHPADVKTLLLMDSGAVNMPTPSAYMEQVQAGHNPLIVRSVADVDVLFEHVFARPLRLPKIFKRIFASEGMARIAANETIFGQIWDDWAMLEPLLEKIEAPTLVMWGKQDRVLDLSMVQILERHLKKHRTVLYDPCGHLPYMEKPAEACRDHRTLMEQGA
ncbi:MAG: alpha/beta fold hydrolase [Polyangiales bacterium]